MTNINITFVSGTYRNNPVTGDYVAVPNNNGTFFQKWNGKDGGFVRVLGLNEDAQKSVKVTVAAENVGYVLNGATDAISAPIIAPIKKVAAPKIVTKIGTSKVMVIGSTLTDAEIAEEAAKDAEYNRIVNNPPVASYIVSATFRTRAETGVVGDVVHTADILVRSEIEADAAYKTAVSRNDRFNISVVITKNENLNLKTEVRREDYVHLLD
jgi:hypothetical protein